MNTTATKTRPILFSSEMVLAILAGRKTMTRRVVNPQPPGDYICCANPERISKSGQGVNPSQYFCDEGTGKSRAVIYSDGSGRNYETRKPISCPYGMPGDRLWVRETWGEFIRRPGETVYKADDPVALGGSNPWRASIHMPRHRSRITLELTGVKVERLQDITEADALAEGVSATHVSGPRFEFAALWIAINGAESWDANLWVWVVSFNRVNP